MCPNGVGGADSALALQFDSLGPRLYDAFLKRGVLLRPLGNVVYFMPPYVITDAEVDRVIGCIREVVKQID